MHKKILSLLALTLSMGLSVSAAGGDLFTSEQNSSTSIGDELEEHDRLLEYAWNHTEYGLAYNSKLGYTSFKNSDTAKSKGEDDSYDVGTVIEYGTEGPETGTIVPAGSGPKGGFRGLDTNKSYTPADANVKGTPDTIALATGLWKYYRNASLSYDGTNYGTKADDYNYLNREDGTGYVLPNLSSNYYTFLGWKLDYAVDYKDPGYEEAFANTGGKKQTIGKNDEQQLYQNGYMYNVSTYDKDTYEQIRTGISGNNSLINSAKDDRGFFDPSKLAGNDALRKAADPLTGNYLPKKDYTLPKVNGIYNRGDASQRIIYDMDGVKDGTPSAYLTTGNFHFSAYWRQNLLTLLMNGGSNKTFGAKKENTVAKFATGTPAKDSKGNMILKNAVASDTATIGNIKWNIDKNGDITRETDSVSDNNGFVIDTRTYGSNGEAKPGYEKIHLVPVEGSVDLIDGNYLNTGAAGIQLYIPDYHLVAGKEWITNDKSQVSKSQGAVSASYSETGVITPTKFSDSDLKKGDKTLKLYGNWAPNFYTITYDVGGKVNANISASVADANIKPAISGKNNSSEAISSVSGSYKKGSFNSYTASQLYTVETQGDIPSPTRKFYDFGGWFIADGNASAPTIRDRNKDGKITSADSVKTYADLLSETPADDRNIRIVAEWKPKTYTLTYNIGAIPASSFDLDYASYIVDPAASTKTAILGTSVVSKSGINKTFNGRSAQSYSITYSVEADGKLAESMTDYLFKNDILYKWQEKSNPKNGHDTYNSLFNSISGGSTLTSIVERVRDGDRPDPQEFTLVVDLGTADLTGHTVNYAASAYVQALSLSGANWANGSGNPSDYNGHLGVMTTKATSTLPGVTPTISGTTLTYGKKTYTFNVLSMGDIPVPAIECHTFSGWYEGARSRNVTKYTDFAAYIPRTGSASYSVTNGSGNKFGPVTHGATATYTVVDSTCVKKGVKVTYCKACGNVTGSAEIALKEHNYGEWKTIIDATCISTGTKERTCLNTAAGCTKSEPGTIDLKPHGYAGSYWDDGTEQFRGVHGHYDGNKWVDADDKNPWNDAEKFNDSVNKSFADANKYVNDRISGINFNAAAVSKDTSGNKEYTDDGHLYIRHYTTHIGVPNDASHRYYIHGNLTQRAVNKKTDGNKTHVASVIVVLQARHCSHCGVVY